MTKKLHIKLNKEIASNQKRIIALPYPAYVNELLPVQDLCPLDNITEILEHLLNSEWSFTLEDCSNLNNTESYMLRKNIDTPEEVICTIKTTTTDMSIVFYTISEYLKQQEANN